MDFTSILKTFSPFSFDTNSEPEIEQLNLLQFESATEDIDKSKKLVLILVESRLLESIPNCKQSAVDLMKRLHNFKTDLQREGFQTRFVEAKVYNGPLHKDGKTLLAIREFFRSVKNAFNNFEGAILIGDFPEAMIVRTWLRPETIAFSIPAENASFPDGTLAYHIGSGIHAYRSEIVLADLSGNWNNLYHLSDAVPSGIFKPDSEKKISTRWTRVTSKKGQYRLDSTHFEDFFWIKDDEWRIESQGQDSISLMMNSNQIDSTRAASNQLNPELSNIDRLAPNGIAQPDIIISRINAKHIATNPDDRLLGDNGVPKRIPYNPGISTDIFRWQFNAGLERKLLIDYFDRNHSFRNGQFSANGPSASKIEYDTGIATANDGLEGIAVPSDEVYNASLLDFIRWLKRPVAIRGISAHTAGRSASLTVFRNDNQYSAIEMETGGNPWRWIQVNGEYIPSFEGQYTADLNLYRTIWENKVLCNISPAFYLLTGFDANTPDKADSIPFNGQEYGACQTAEGVLFYCNGLAVVSQSKMSYEGPKGFGFGFGSSDNAHFGNGWKEYYRYESQNAIVGRNPTERKRSSFWSIIGDWTLRKSYMPSMRTDFVQTRTSSGFLKQSNFGRFRGSLELVIPNENAGFNHFSRANDDPMLTWQGPFLVSTDAVDSCSIIQSNFGDLGNLEVILRCGSHLQYFWREDTWPFEWHKEEVSAFSAYDYTGNPALIQGNLGGSLGNFELIIPLKKGGFAHLLRNNHEQGLPWEGPIFFGDQEVEISGVAMIQSNSGFSANLEIVAVEKNRGRLVHYWRENSAPYNWQGPIYFGGPGFTGIPSLLQRHSGAESGNFDLVVPVKGGGLAHYCKLNKQEGNPWYGPVYFGNDEVSAVSMVETNTTQSGNLELIAVENGKPVRYWRDDSYPHNWHGPEDIIPVPVSQKKKKFTKTTSVTKETVAV